MFRLGLLHGDILFVLQPGHTVSSIRRVASTCLKWIDVELKATTADVLNLAGIKLYIDRDER